MQANNQIGFGARQHDAYEVSPFYYMGRGHYSLTAGGAHLGRVVPVSGPPAPFYWGDDGVEIDDAGMGQMTRRIHPAAAAIARREGAKIRADVRRHAAGVGREAERRAKRFEKLHSDVLRRRAKGQDIPRPLRQAYKRQREITPGAEKPAIPVKLVPHPLISARGPAGFLQWFRRTHPFLFARMERERPDLLVKGEPAMRGLGQAPDTVGDPITSQEPAPKGWTDKMFGFLDKVLANKHQKNMAEVNLELARQGYAPVGFVEQAQAKVAQAAQAIREAPPAARFGIPLALLAGGAALFFFARR